VKNVLTFLGGMALMATLFYVPKLTTVSANTGVFYTINTYDYYSGEMLDSESFEAFEPKDVAGRVNQLASQDDGYVVIAGTNLDSSPNTSNVINAINIRGAFLLQNVADE